MITVGGCSQILKLSRDFSTAPFVRLKKRRIVRQQKAPLAGFHVHERLQQGGRLHTGRSGEFEAPQHFPLSLVLRDERQNEENGESRKADRQRGKNRVGARCVGPA